MSQYVDDRYESVCWLWRYHIENLSHYNWLSARVHLSPLLFIIYINDIHEASSNFKTILYADDTNLMIPLCLFRNSGSAKNTKMEEISENISNELNSILEWLNINKLSLNVKKTKFMLFHYHQCNVNSLIPKLTLNSEPIERVTECNFLGLTIDGPPHIQKISNKKSRTIRIMCRLRFLPTHILKLIYTSYFADFRNCKKEQFVQ